MQRRSFRALATAARALKEVKKTPEQFLAAQSAKVAENSEFRLALAATPFEYKPLYVSENTVDATTKRPVPLNVELLQYEPLQVPRTHGHKVAEVHLRGYNTDSIDMAGEFLARAGFYLGIPCSKVQFLKTEKRLYTVIKSPFAQAKSKENFKRTTYNRKIVAYDANPEVVDLWLSFVNKHALADVNYTVQMYTRESLEFSKELDAITLGDLKLPEAYEGTTDPIGRRVAELLQSETFKEQLE